jgi:hypothetical protein
MGLSVLRKLEAGSVTALLFFEPFKLILSNDYSPNPESTAVWQVIVTDPIFILTLKTWSCGPGQR